MFDTLIESFESDYEYINFTEEDAWMFLPSEVVGEFDSVETLCE